MLSLLLHCAACALFVALYSDLLLLDVISTTVSCLKDAVSDPLFGLSAARCYTVLSKLLYCSACSLCVALLLDVICTAAGWLKAILCCWFCLGGSYQNVNIVSIFHQLQSLLDPVFDVPLFLLQSFMGLDLIKFSGLCYITSRIDTGHSISYYHNTAFFLGLWIFLGLDLIKMSSLCYVTSHHDTEHSISY